MKRICEFCMMLELCSPNEGFKPKNAQEILDLYRADKAWHSVNALRLNDELATAEQRFYLGCAMLSHEDGGDGVLNRAARRYAETLVELIGRKNINRVLLAIYDYEIGNLRKGKNGLSMRIMGFVAKMFVKPAKGTYKNMCVAIQFLAHEDSFFKAVGTGFSLAWGSSVGEEEKLKVAWNRIVNILLEEIERK